MSVKIKGVFEIKEDEYAETVDMWSEMRKDSHVNAADAITYPKYQIRPHPGFEKVQTPDGNIIKLAYHNIYPATTTDLDIELACILRIETEIDKKIKAKVGDHYVRQKLPGLKFHYKRALSLMTPKIAAGWNRWSDNILDLFLINKVHKVLWGSGNCGKSAVMAALLYTKWRANPGQRMVVIASRVVKDASARVYGYIKDIHVDSPGSSQYDFKLVDSNHMKGIFVMKWEDKEGKMVADDRACIVNLPVKVNADTAEYGANLLGKHPDDRLILAFDEAQELPATMLSDTIFLNWYTNERLDIYAWGNPKKVDFTTPESWDMLFKLGASSLSLQALKQKEVAAKKTSVWSWGDTMVLRFTMLDSPKDDPDEVNCMVKRADGSEVQRLWFLAGKHNVETIAAKVAANTPSWYSQVLGFPFIQKEGSAAVGVITPIMVRESKLYPLNWKYGAKAEFFMGVDPAASGKHDAASIVVAKMARMEDGRMGIDVMNGDGSVQVLLKDGEDFIDSIVSDMYSLSNRYGVPLRNIAVETHGVGEALRYAIMRHVENGKWKEDYDKGQMFTTVSPMAAVSDLYMYKMLGTRMQSHELVADKSTELWYAIRCAFLTRQIFNVPEVIVQQLLQRQLLLHGSKGRYKMETKAQMQKRGIKSPNDADALSNAIELMRRRGFVYEYTDTGGYGGKMVKERNNKLRAEDRLNKSFSVVSDLLGLELNLGQHSGRKKGIRSIDVI